MTTPSSYSETAASSRFELAKWTFNVSSFAPSAKDLLLAGPRIGTKLGSLFTMPAAIDNMLGGHFRPHSIPEATPASLIDAVTTGRSIIVQDVAHTGSNIITDVDDMGSGITSRISVESARSFGNLFQYSTSRWALACIIMAIVLNRTNVYASTRRNLTLGWKLRLSLRAVPIILFALQARTLLQSIQCQTSPDFGLLRWGNASKSSDLMFNQNGGFLHTISSTLLFDSSDGASCRAVNMVPASDEKDHSNELAGSLSRLWPLFETLCFSHFVETLSCAVQGRQIAAETGMTLFEHSLAFAEAEAAVSSALGWGPFGEKSSNKQAGSTEGETASEAAAIQRSMILKRVNTPPEVLLVGFLSSMNHLTSHILAVFNLQGRLRLPSTAIWGLCFMFVITGSILSFSADDSGSQALLRFPTVCVIGFIPHVLVFGGILLCSTIYSLALILTTLALPSDAPYAHATFLQKLQAAHNNMQANVSLASIRVSMHMDFYQALLKVGYNALTIASEAVYLNESAEVQIKERTWLEEERLKELEDNRAAWIGPAFKRSHQNGPENVGLTVLKAESPNSRRLLNGFARERVPQNGAKSRSSERTIRDGIGATERSGRWIMAFEYIVGIARLVASWCAAVLRKLFAQIGIRRLPHWLTWIAARPKLDGKRPLVKQDDRQDNLEFWMLGPDGELILPEDDNVDVEAEMRKRLKGDRHLWDNVDEQRLESNLYSWWLNGGWWGSDDSSGSFKPSPDIDDDTTSVISSSTDTNLDWESDDVDNEGRRTPTQTSFSSAREFSPPLDNPLSSANLAQLLRPQNIQQREEAHALAAHLASDEIITRSRYNELHQREKTQILMSARWRSIKTHADAPNRKLTPEEESEILEHILSSRRASRSNNPATAFGSSVWTDGGTGLGEDGPQCVVCQSSPRSIIVWPCRCLSLCDDCRVTLAMNNFDKCVCCRRDVCSFSRIFVP